MSVKVHSHHRWVTFFNYIAPLSRYLRFLSFHLCLLCFRFQTAKIFNYFWNNALPWQFRENCFGQSKLVLHLANYGELCQLLYMYVRIILYLRRKGEQNSTATLTVLRIFEKLCYTRFAGIRVCSVRHVYVDAPSR